MKSSLPITIIFDDHCSICSSFIDLLKRFDRRNSLHFVKGHSATGLELRKEAQMTGFNSILVKDSKNYFIEGMALRKIIKALTGCSILNIVPLKLINFSYKFFAGKRYWFSDKVDKCSARSCKF